jgi:hypothetical protein
MMIAAALKTQLDEFQILLLVAPFLEQQQRRRDFHDRF